MIGHGVNISIWKYTNYHPTAYLPLSCHPAASQVIKLACLNDPN